MENLKNNKNSKAQKITEIPNTSTIAEQTIVERQINDEPYRKTHARTEIHADRFGII